MDYVIGIDQGGTKTQAVAADITGAILGVVSVPGSNHAVNGLPHAMVQITEAVRQVTSGLSADQRLVAVGAGITGADFPQEYEQLHQALRGLFSCPVQVVNDCMIALRAGTFQKNAAVLCAGTGVNCGIRDANGNELVFGYYIDDRWQGGSAIAERALRAVFDAQIGLGPPTLLTQLCLKRFAANDVEELLQRWVQKGIADNAQRNLALDVDHSAALGDAVAADILHAFARAWAQYVIVGLRRFDLLQTQPEIVLSGSIFKSETSILRQTVETEVHAACPGARVLEARYEPVVGGVILALEQLGAPYDSEKSILALQASADRQGLIRSKSAERFA